MPVQQHQFEVPRSLLGDVGGVEWQLTKLRALREEMHEEQLVCPLVWLTKGLCEGVCPHKLLDLLHFAPCDFDSVICALVIISRGVLLNEKTFPQALEALAECRSAAALRPGTPPACPLLARNRTAIIHMVDATWVMLQCLHEGLAVRAVLATLAADHRAIPKCQSLGVEDQGAIAAARSLSFQIVHYTLWPSLMDERKPIFKDAVESAACAMALAPKEGVWYSLYARCLSWADPAKSVLLQAGYRLHKTPFTVMEYASLLAYSGHADGVKEAAQLVEFAVRRWPNCVYVLANYVTLYLNSHARNLLSMATAEAALRRARTQAPDSPLLAGHHWSLRDVFRAGGHLSPILEEGEGAFADIASRWSPEKEAALVAIAARLYPAALLQKQQLTRPPQSAPAPAAPQQVPAPAGGLGADLGDGPPSTLWSPKPLRKPGKSNPPSPSSSSPSPDSSVQSYYTPATSPNSSNPSPAPVATRTSRSRIRPLISGPLRRPRTTPTSPVEAPLESTLPPERGAPVSAPAAESSVSSSSPSPPSSLSPSPPPIVPPPPEFCDASEAPSAPAAPSAVVAPAPEVELKVPAPRRAFPRQSPPAAAFRASSRSATPSPVTVQAVTAVAPPSQPGPALQVPSSLAAPAAVTDKTGPVKVAVTPVSTEAVLLPPSAFTRQSIVPAPTAVSVPAQRAAPPAAATKTALLPPAASTKTVLPPAAVTKTASQPPSTVTTSLAPAAARATPVQTLAAPVPLMSIKVACRPQAQSRLDRLHASAVLAKDRAARLEGPSSSAFVPVARTVPVALATEAKKAATAVEPCSVQGAGLAAPSAASSSAAPAPSTPWSDPLAAQAPPAVWSEPLAAPGAAKSRLRPNAPSWVPPALRPASAPGSRPASPTSMPRLRPSSPSSAASMRPVAAPTPPATPPSRPASTSWSDPYLGQPLQMPCILPPMEYKCPAQGRLVKLTTSLPKPEGQKLQAEPDSTTGTLGPSSVRERPVGPSSVREQPVSIKMEVPTKIEQDPCLLTPPEVDIIDSNEVLRTLKQEPSVDMSNRRARARVNLTSQFDAEVKTDVKPTVDSLKQNLSKQSQAPTTPASADVTESKPSGRGMVLICDDKSMAECVDLLGPAKSGRTVSRGKSRLFQAATTSGTFARVAAQIGLIGKGALSAPASSHASKKARTESFPQREEPRMTAPVCPHGGGIPAEAPVPSVPQVPLDASRIPPQMSTSAIAPDSGASSVTNLFVAPQSSTSTSFFAKPPSSSGTFMPPPATSTSSRFGSSTASSVAPPPAASTSSLFGSSTASFVAPPPAASTSSRFGSTTASSVALPPAASTASRFGSTTASSVASAPEDEIVSIMFTIPGPVVNSRPSRSVCPDALAEVHAVLEEERSRSRVWEADNLRRRHRSRSPERVYSRTSLGRSRTPSTSGSSPTVSRTASPAPGDSSKAEDNVPLWRRGGGDGAPTRSTDLFTSWRKPISPAAAAAAVPEPATAASYPAAAAIPSAVPDLTVKASPASAVPDPSAAALPSSTARCSSAAAVTSAVPKPTTDPAPMINCVCSSDCVFATFRAYKDLRPGPEVPKLCLKQAARATSSGARSAPVPVQRRLSSRLPSQFLS